MEEADEKNFIGEGDCGDRRELRDKSLIRKWI